MKTGECRVRASEWIARILFAAGFLLAGAAPVACTHSVGDPTGKIDPRTCSPLRSDKSGWLPAEWKDFARVADVCAIRSESGAAVLYLVAVSARRYYSPLPSGAATVAMPRPILFSPEGMKVGTLPYNFPDDPPFALEVTCADWREGFPHRLELFLRDPTVSGDHALAPLVWDTARRSFSQGALN